MLTYKCKCKFMCLTVDASEIKRFYIRGNHLFPTPCMFKDYKGKIIIENLNGDDICC